VFAAVLLAFVPSLLAGFLFGRRGVAAACACELLAVWLVFLGSKALTGMEGLALKVCQLLVLVQNGPIFLLVGSNPPRTEAR
jgi:hypothetical protein